MVGGKAIMDLWFSGYRENVRDDEKVLSIASGDGYTQHCEFISCHQIVCLPVVEMINTMLHPF